MHTGARFARIAAAAAVVAVIVAVPAGTATAQPRNPCSDMQNKERLDALGGISREMTFKPVLDAQGKVISQQPGELEIRYGDPLPVPAGYEETFGDRAAC